jgi:hypothetical protein
MPHPIVPDFEKKKLLSCKGDPSRISGCCASLMKKEELAEVRSRNPSGNNGISILLEPLRAINHYVAIAVHIDNAAFQATTQDRSLFII